LSFGLDVGKAEELELEIQSTRLGIDIYVVLLALVLNSNCKQLIFSSRRCGRSIVMYQGEKKTGNRVGVGGC
jgi:hypothetical protein